MRAGDGFEIGVAPRDEPLRYPGALPPFSFLLTDAGFERLDDVDERGLDGCGLHDRLERLAVAPIEQRHAVLAFGSNRSPAQLLAKFTGDGVNPVVPVLRASLADLSVVFTAGMATYGSVPASLVVDPGASTEVAVTFLDDDQLVVMDRTEGAHHTRPALAPEHGLRLLGGVEVTTCRRYRSSRPVLTWDGAPIRMAEVGSVGSRLVCRSQAEVHRLLVDVWRDRLGHHGDGSTFVAAVRAERAVHEAANGALRGLEPEPLGRLGAATVVWPDEP
jgi:hypothetical protein